MCAWVFVRNTTAVPIYFTRATSAPHMRMREKAYACGDRSSAYTLKAQDASVSVAIPTVNELPPARHRTGQQRFPGDGA